MNQNSARLDQGYGSQVIESYLYKKKSDSALFKWINKFIKRWFVLNLKEQVFYYSKDRNTKVQQKVVNLKDVRKIHSNCAIDLSQCEYKYSFIVDTQERTWILIAQDYETQQKFYNGFQSYLDYTHRLSQHPKQDIFKDKQKLIFPQLQQESPQSKNQQSSQIITKNTPKNSLLKSSNQKQEIRETQEAQEVQKVQEVHESKKELQARQIKIHKKIQQNNQVQQINPISQIEYFSWQNEEITVRKQLNSSQEQQLINTQDQKIQEHTKRQEAFEIEAIQELEPVPVPPSYRKSFVNTNITNEYQVIPQKEVKQRNLLSVEEVPLKIKNIHKKENQNKTIKEQQSQIPFNHEPVIKEKLIQTQKDQIQINSLNLQGRQSRVDLLQNIDSNINQTSQEPIKQKKQTKQQNQKQNSKKYVETEPSLNKKEKESYQNKKQSDSQNQFKDQRIQNSQQTQRQKSSNKSQVEKRLNYKEQPEFEADSNLKEN